MEPPDLGSMKLSTSSSPGDKQLMPDEVDDQETRFLTSVEDKYDGVTVEIKGPMDSVVYVSLLQASLSTWRQQAKKGVWIKLPTKNSNLVEPTIKEGFRYHHAEADHLTLVRWLPDIADTLPANASHTVGVGAFVMNSEREVLVVKERNGAFRAKDVWKFPTGVVNQGEDICMAAVREVQEETGIKTEFVEILAFNQTHGAFCGKSDLFFVCMLRPLSFDIEKQDSEIKAAQWMPIEMYAAQPYNIEHESFKYVADVCLKKSKEVYNGFSAATCTTSSGKRSFILYLNEHDLRRAG